MVSQVVAILFLILAGEGWPALLTLGQLALWVAVFTAVASAVDYYRRFNHVLLGRDPAIQSAPAPRSTAASAVNRDQVSNVHRVH
jgi:hypothetical protein